MIRYFLLHPPKWIERILRHFRWYRMYFINAALKEMAAVLTEEFERREKENA